MDECPYCAAELNRPAHRRNNRTNGGAGGKSLADELIACSECGGVIDGFASH